MESAGSPFRKRTVYFEDRIAPHFYYHAHFCNAGAMTVKQKEKGPEYRGPFLYYLLFTGVCETSPLINNWTLPLGIFAVTVTALLKAPTDAALNVALMNPDRKSTRLN